MAPLVPPLRGLGLLGGLLTLAPASALPLQPLDAGETPFSAEEQRLGLPVPLSPVQEAEAFAPTTTVRVEVNAVTGALAYDGIAVERPKSPFSAEEQRLGLPVLLSPVQEAEAFAPTTTVRVEVNAVTGALAYDGSAVERGANTAAGFPLLNALTVNQDARLTIDTSFTGQDFFRLRLRSGDFAPSGFFSNPPTPLTRLDVAFQEPLCPRDSGGCGNQVTVNRAFLQLPLSPEFRFTVGSRLMQLDLLPVWPSVYTASPILELFQRAGAAGAYSRRVGSGFGAWWQPEGRLKGVSLAYGYVAPRGAEGAPARGGWYTAAGSDSNTVQLAYTRPTWNLTAAYTRNGQRAQLRGTPLASQLASESRDGALHSWSLAGYWQPMRATWIPAISAGWGWDQFAFARYPVAGLNGVRTSSWSVGLSWEDAFGKGNSVLLAVGAPAHVTGLGGLAGIAADDSGLAFELASRIRLSDGFSVTPAVFWLTRPRGAMGGSSSLSAVLGPGGSGEGGSLGVWGVLVRGTLRF